MIKEIHELMGKANAKKMVLTITSTSESDAAIFLATEFAEQDAENPIQKKLALPLVASGYVGSLDVELTDAILAVGINETMVNEEKTEPCEVESQNNSIDCL